MNTTTTAAAPRTETLRALPWSVGTVFRLRAVTPAGRISLKRFEKGEYVVTGMAPESREGQGHSGYVYLLTGPRGVIRVAHGARYIAHVRAA